MNSNEAFSPHQIVCLDSAQACLYSEIIQIVTSRHLCWVRPLLLATATENYPPEIVDVRFTCDLIWPLTRFRRALDTELVPLLASVEALPGQEELQAQKQLQKFVRQLWED